MSAQQQALRVRLVGPLALSVPDVIPWGLIVAFAALVTGLLAGRLGHILELVFPAAAAVVGATLYFQHPTLYLGFTWWLWFLTPEVRRLVDYQIGWNPISPVMIAPYLVAGLAGLTLVRCLPQLLQPRLFPFVLILMALNYGYTIGLVRAGPLAATYGLLTWLVPVVFGFHVAVRWQQYPLYRDALQRVFLWGVLAMGLYGMVQWFAIPPWDAYWASVSGMGSLNHWLNDGSSTVRVWSTMNSPSPFAHVMMAGLLSALAVGGPFRFIAGAPGFIAFLLSLVRSAWLGLAIGAVFLLVRAHGVQKMRLLAVAAVLCLLSMPLLLFGPAAKTVTERLGSMQQLDEDGSYRSRLQLYGNFILASSTNVVGQGIGSANLATKLANDPDLAQYRTIDAGFLEIMFVLGWPGTLLYLAGLCWLLSVALSRRARSRDLAVQAAGAIVLATLAMNTSYNTLIGVGGMIFWSYLGLSLAAGFFTREEERIQLGRQIRLVERDTQVQG